jgi:hypothetical protein
MKISYRTHLPLRNLKSGTLSGLRFSDELRFHEKQLDDVFIKHIEYFTKSIKVFSKPFGDSALKAVSKPIKDGFFETFVSALDYTGTLVIAHYTIFIIAKPYARLYFMFADDTLMAYLAKQDNKGAFWCTDSMIIGDGKKETCEYWEVVFLSLLFFIEYAEVETKRVDANRKSKAFACKYVNDTSLNLQFYDSKYFTSIVKSSSFNVRGHWRLQPCGEGLKDRKLIWINDFQKEGYTAPARKLQSEL